MATVGAIIDEAINAAREDPDRDAPLIHLLLETPDPQTGRPLTQQAIADELLAFLVAGHDTTATTLAYSLWAVGRDPVIQDRLATEVADIGDRVLTVDDVSRLPHTVRVIHEALRLCPPAAVVTRMTMRDTVVDGFRIPQGTNVIVGIYPLHRDPELWEQPELFDPDRFAPERSARSGPLAVPPVQRRPADLHRRSFRHARSHPGTGQHRAHGADHGTEQRFPGRAAIHHDGCRPGSGPADQTYLTA